MEKGLSILVDVPQEELSKLLILIVTLISLSCFVLEILLDLSKCYFAFLYFCNTKFPVIGAVYMRRASPHRRAGPPARAEFYFSLTWKSLLLLGLLDMMAPIILILFLYFDSVVSVSPPPPLGLRLHGKFPALLGEISGIEY